jgi:hypothetical protein
MGILWIWKVFGFLISFWSGQLSTDPRIDIMVHIGDNSYSLVTIMRKKNKRFSVSLSERDYRRFNASRTGTPL